MSWSPPPRLLVVVRRWTTRDGILYIDPQLPEMNTNGIIEHAVRETWIMVVPGMGDRRRGAHGDWPVRVGGLDREPPSIFSWMSVELPRSHSGITNWADRSLELASRRRTQAALLVSANVLSRAAEDLQIKRPALLARKSDPIAWLQAGLRVDDVSNSLLVISMPGERRADQAVIVNAVVDALLIECSDWESGPDRARRDRLEESVRG